MDRRSFLKLAGMGAGATVGLGTLGASWLYSNLDKGFDTKRSDVWDLFPSPIDGEVLEISPPPFTWLPGRINKETIKHHEFFHYTVMVWNSSGSLIHEVDTGCTPLHIPNEVFPPGEYTWDVAISDITGKTICRRGRQQFTIAPNPTELPWMEPATLLSAVSSDHPRIMYRKDDLPRIRSLIHTSRRQGWSECLRLADEACSLPRLRYPTHFLPEDRAQRSLEYQQYYRSMDPVLDRALICAPLAYLVTGEQRYAEAGKRTLLEIASWAVEDGDVTSVSKTYGDEVGLRIARVVPLAYDWLHDALTTSERRAVFHMCEERAWQLYRRLCEHDFHARPGESHNGRIITYLAQTAIALAGESDGAQTWLDYSLKALMTVFPHWGGRDGGWAEGPLYSIKYNDSYIPAFESLKKLCGLDLWKRPYYRKLLHYVLYCLSPCGEFLPFGDGTERGMIGRTLPFWEHAHVHEDAHAGWWLRQADGSNCNETIPGYQRNFGTGAAILAFDDNPPIRPPTDIPQSAVFRGIGWVAMHSSLAEPERDTFLLFKSSPYGSVSHSHPDQNSFAILKGGKALAIPSGYFAPRYFFPHHKFWTHSTQANNTILVNGEGQPRHDHNATGRICGFEDRSGLTYACGDATTAYMGNLAKYKRHILFLRPGLFLILDELEADSARFQWLLHALERMDVDPSRNHIVSQREGTRMDVHIRSTAGLSLTQTDQFQPPINEGSPPGFELDLPDHWHLTAETVNRADSVRVAALITVTGPDEEVDVDIREENGWFGATATFAEGTVEGWAQLTEEARGPDAFGTDVRSGAQILCGRAHDGDVLSV